MGSFAKWIGGGLGWALGGPIGALIGFLVGSYLDSTTTNALGSKPFVGSGTTEGDFKMSLVVLVACVMKADGNVKKTELAVVKRFLVVNFGEPAALEALGMLKQLLEKDINVVEVAKQINQYMNYPGRLELLHLLFEIGYADGELHPAEFTMIQRIAGVFDINRLDFESIQAPYGKQKDQNWAYKVLEIQPSASNDDIKAAYRTMAKKYHPDKVSGMGEDIKKTATEKFRSVNEAFESLKKQRGFF